MVWNILELSLMCILWERIITVFNKAQTITGSVMVILVNFRSVAGCPSSVPRPNVTSVLRFQLNIETVWCYCYVDHVMCEFTCKYKHVKYYRQFCEDGLTFHHRKSIMQTHKNTKGCLSRVRRLFYDATSTVPTICQRQSSTQFGTRCSWCSKLPDVSYVRYS